MDIFSGLKKYWNWNRVINNIKYLIQNDLSEREYKIKDQAVEDCIYEFEESRRILPQLKILDSDTSIQILLQNPKSFARFGDGEIKLMEGIDSPFQSYDAVLARKMLKILTHKRDDLYVGLNRSYFQSPFAFSERNHRFYRQFGTEFRRFFLNTCDPTNVYLDACCFGGYFRLDENYDFERLYERNKALFKGKNIAIVAGEGVLEKLQFDVFEYADKKIVLHAPSKNAFSQYNGIIDMVKKRITKDYIVCLILGMTATVLAADLTDLGYIAWDIGHMAKDYDAYMKKLDRTKENIDNFWAPD